MLSGAKHRVEMGENFIALPYAATAQLGRLGELAKPFPVAHSVDAPTAVISNTGSINKRLIQHSLTLASWHNGTRAI